MFGCEYTSAARWLKYNGFAAILIGLSFYFLKITLIKFVPPVTPVTAVTPVTPRVFISALCPIPKIRDNLDRHHGTTIAETRKKQ